MDALGLLGVREREPPEETTGFEKFLVFLPVFVYRSYVRRMSYWLLSRFRAPAAPRQIGIVIEKNNLSLSISVVHYIACK